MKGKCSEHLKRIAELQENDFKRGGYERAAVAVKELEDNLVDLEGLSEEMHPVCLSNSSSKEIF